MAWNKATNLFRSSLNTFSSNSNDLQPGSLLSVGSLRVQVIKKLAEGGFAFVYMVKEVSTDQTYALKRLLVNDTEDLNKVKEEIEFMRRIPRHKNIVEFRSAGTSQGASGSEVLIVMEFCPEPSLYEILDRRFKNYFSESEVLEIFSNVCEGVAHLHSQSPPIAHRDLKVENVLKHGPVYKLCDFGSATTKTFLPENSSSINRIEDEINRYTTAAYRSPEMVDLWRMQLINEKADIWALGCLLFRICFFFHPFDEGGNLGILNVNYEIPKNSPYSSELHKFIQFMIEPNPAARPNIFQVIERLSALRGIPHSGITPPQQQIRAQPQPTQQKNTKSPATNSPAATAAPANDLFSMLDWHDSNHTTHSVSAPVVSTHTSSAVDNFADFSNASFVNTPPVGLHQETSFFATPEAQQQLATPPTTPVRTSDVLTSSGNTPTNLSGQSSPVIPQHSKPAPASTMNIRNTFAVALSDPPISSTSSQNTPAISSVDLFSNFSSSPSPVSSQMGSTSSGGFDFAAFQSPTSLPYDSSSNLNMRGSGNLAGDFGHVGMPGDFGFGNTNNGMRHSTGPAPQHQQFNAHTRHSSFGNNANYSGSLFDSVAATAKQSTPQNPAQVSGDAYANLRNLI